MQILPAAVFNNAIIENTACQTRTGGSRKTKKYKYKDLITAFDIETTRIPAIEQSIMYIWQFAIEDVVYIGRTWPEFMEVINSICGALEDMERLVIWVHNLSYEFQFLAGIYKFMPSEVFAVDSRRVLKCSMYDKIEFRCSYLQTNMSLAEFTQKMGVKHCKLSGESFDYEKIRYPWTELTDTEIDYCVHDVVGLVEAVHAELDRDHDDLYTIPATSTGYVRRDAKRAMSKKALRASIRSMQPDYELYIALRNAFRGGDTHASRFYAGRIINHVDSFDRSSSYPDVIVNCKFPISPFYHVGPCSLPDFKFYKQKGRAMVMLIALTDFELENPFSPVPYIPKAKCTTLTGAALDNGRVLSAEYAELYCTDIDLDIILDEYKGRIEILDLWHARYGYLPRSYRELVIYYYEQKTQLKGVQGQDVYYTKSKNLLNALYGMMAQDPVKQSIEFINGDFVEREDNPEELLYEAVKHSFECYQWGVWVTAHARRELRAAINLVGDNFIYCDTDSVKYAAAGFSADAWDKLNKSIRSRARKNGAYATDPGGETHFMGVWEADDSYTEFKTLGAKKYVYRLAGTDKLKCTIAGVGKKAGAAELEKYGGLEAFTEGFIFNEAGGLESVYNDSDYGMYTIEGHDVYISRNVVLRPSTYTVGITADYARLLSDDRYIKLFMEEFVTMAKNTRAKKENAEAFTKKVKNSIITEVRLYPGAEEYGILANVNVTFGGVFVVTGIKVIDGKKGAFVSMPSYKSGKEYKDSCFPITADFREELYEAILDAYDESEF